MFVAAGLQPTLTDRASARRATQRRRAAAANAVISEDEQERLLAAPRLKFGLDVHRRVHAQAAQSLGYLFQWRAFCERQKRDWRDAHGEFDEDVLAVFHFELERSLARFEADCRAGRSDSWPARR